MSNPGAPTAPGAPQRSRAVAAGRLLATVLALLAGLAVLWRAGAALPTLPLDRAGVARAFTESDPLALAVAVIRLMGLAVGVALLALTALGVAARCCGAVRLVVRVDRWTPPSLRRLLDGALGCGLAASIGLGAAPAGADAGQRQPAAATTIHRLPDSPSPTLRRLPDTAPEVTPPGLPLRRLPDAGPASPAASATPPEPGARASPAPPAPAAPAEPAVGGGATAVGSPPPVPSTPAVPSPAPAAAPIAASAEVVVRPGESFWRLAEQHEARRLGRAATEAEIGACWQELVAVNRHRLAVPDDPDLLFPGQRLILPCP